MPRGRARGRRADYEWSAGCFKGAGIDLANGTKSSEDLGAITGPATLVRTRGEIFLQLDATAVDERVIIAMGLIVASENAAAAGAASLPSPVSDGADDWYWYGFATMSSLAETAVQPDALFTRVVIDSKAMRKVKPTEHLVLVLEVCDGVDQNGSFDYLGGCRSLFAS